MSMSRMRPGLGVVALALAGCCFCLSARQSFQVAVQAVNGPTSSQAPRAITGMVVNSVTAEPIRRALVRINGSGQSFAFTGADGRFQIDNVPGGNAFFTVTAEKPGFFDPSQMGVGNNPPVTLQSGSNEVLLKLNPQTIVQGRITDGDGEPIEGVQVQLMVEQIANGRKEWRPQETAQTRNNGTYRMENLMPGLYLVHTIMRPEFAFQSGRETGQVVQEAYPERFYPNSPDLVSAQPLDCKPGEQAQADFTLSAVRAFNVSGSVNPPERGFISVQSVNGEREFSPIMAQVQAGRFRLATVPSGSWILSFHSESGRGSYAEQLITVGSDDLSGVQLQLQSLASIPIEVAGASDAASMPVQVQLVPKEKQGNVKGYGSSFLQPGNPQQSLKIENVPPGKYTVIAQPNGAGCIDSVSSGSIDLTRDDLTVSSDSQAPITVRLREDCPSVAGTVHAETGATMGFVILLPSAAFIEPRIAPVQPDGRFDFGSLSPGEYRLYAFSNIDGLEYANPEAMRDFAGQQIDLQPNQKANVTLDQVVRGKS